MENVIFPACYVGGDAGLRQACYEKGGLGALLLSVFATGKSTVVERPQVAMGGL